MQVHELSITQMAQACVQHLQEYFSSLLDDITEVS
jgi:hypothetical protein